MNAIICEDKNFIDDQQKESIKTMVNSHQFPWYFNQSSVMKLHLEKHPQAFFDPEYMEDIPVLVHGLYSDMIPTSHFFNDIIQIFDLFCKSNNIFYKSILRAKVNLVQKKHGKNYLAQPAHVDYPFDHKVFLYYVDNSDGDTIIYNERYSGESISGVSLLHSISPEIGKGVVFDGNHFHSPTPPIFNDKRITLNVAFL